MPIPPRKFISFEVLAPKLPAFLPEGMTEEQLDKLADDIAMQMIKDYVGREEISTMAD